MRKNLNTETIEGRVYEHDLALKTVQNKQSDNFGKPFIQGSVSVATDEEGLNVLTVHYTYVTENTKAGGKNATYANLQRIIGGKTWVQDGKDQAMKVRLTPSAALNDFYPQGEDPLVSQQRNEGGFVSIVNELKSDVTKRSEFRFDTIINNVTLVEADPEKGIAEDYAKINCVIFNFKNDILPYTLVAKSPAAIDYFMGLGASTSEPIYTQVWGQILSTTVKVEKTVESAFGTPAVDITEKRQREWVVTGAKPEPYIFGDESTITVEELSKAIADRNVYLEEIKTRTKEYYNSKNAIASKPAASSTAIPEGKFNF